MICPACGYENLLGADTCDNCGADLRTSDIPHPGTRFEAQLVAEPLAALEGREPVIVPVDAAVEEVIRTMQERESEAVLVLEDERLAGIFTERDALLKLAGQPLDGVRVGDVMTRDPVVLRAEDNMAVAVHKMAVGRFRHVPVVDASGVRGIVSARDVFGHLIELLDGAR